MTVKALFVAYNKHLGGSQSMRSRDVCQSHVEEITLKTRSEDFLCLHEEQALSRGLSVIEVTLSHHSNVYFQPHKFKSMECCDRDA